MRNLIIMFIIILKGFDIMSKLDISIGENSYSKETFIKVYAECPCPLSYNDKKEIMANVQGYIASLVLSYVVKYKQSSSQK